MAVEMSHLLFIYLMPYLITLAPITSSRCKKKKKSFKKTTVDTFLKARRREFRQVIARRLKGN